MTAPRCRSREKRLESQYLRGQGPVCSSEHLHPKGTSSIVITWCSC